MKRIVFAFTLLLTLLLLTACDNGSVSDSSVSNTSGLVKVSLAVENGSSEMQKSISINGVNFTYFYKAVPQWSQDRPIAGSTNNQFVQIPGYDSGDHSLGYFSPGEWIFYAQVRIGDTPIYEGDSGIISINTSQNVINVPVEKIIPDIPKPGRVSINIKAPTIYSTGNNQDALTITWGDGQGVSESTTASSTADGAITTFTCEVEYLDPGTYTFTFSHNNATGRGGAIAVDLRQNEIVVITGQLDNGEWLLRSINLAVYSITVISNQYGKVWAPITAAVPGDRVDFSLNPNDGASVLSCLIVRDEEEQIQPIDTNNFQYSFIMPAGNVTINAEFGVADDIEVEEFQTLFLYFYIRNYNSVVSFGRAANGPGDGVEYKQKNKIKIWYDSTNNKICWHSDVDGNILKFKQGSLSGLFMSTTFTSIDLTGFDTSNIDNMSHLFDGCVKLKTVNLAGINTRAVTDMSYMFYKAGYSYIPMQNKNGTLLDKIPNTGGQYLSITGLDGNDFKTDLVENMEYMFSLCSAQDLNVSGFKASRVTNFSHMFAGKSENNYANFWPTKFTSLDVSNWEVGENVAANAGIDMSNMFDISYRLTSLSFTNWDFSKVTTMYEMFNRCESATHIYFPAHTDLTNVTTLKGVFNHTAAMVAKGDGSLDPGSFEDIFQRWDIRYNDYTQGLGGMIDFKEIPHDADRDNSANHLFQNDTESLRDAALVVNSYGDLNNPGPPVKVGGWGNTNDYKKMRLIKNP